MQLTSFVGREKELVDLGHRLRETRLLTLTGAGGTGKTRLAIEVASALASETGSPAWFVPLDACHEPDLVPQVVCTAIGVPEVGDRQPLHTLVAWLCDASGLVVMDNCEHLLEPVGVLVQALLLGCRRIRVLATSRTVLSVPSEVTWRVPSLQVSAADSPLDLAAVARIEAVRLFVERAALADPAFRLTEDNAAAVNAICRRLDGIPLSIELASARVRVLAPGQMLERLRDAPSFLTGGSAMTVARHRTLSNTIQWSYDLLRPPERELFEKLSVFSGGFQLEAAEALAGADILDPLTGLVEHSLVIVQPGRPANMRYRVLEVLRQFAEARLTETGEADRLRLRHAAYYADLVEAAEPELMGEHQIERMTALRQERDNLRAALAWSLSHGTAADGDGAGDRLRMGLRLVAALWFFWYADGAPIEGARWLDALFSRLDGAPREPRSLTLQARALAGASWLAYVRSQSAKAARLANRSLQVLEGDDDAEARANAWTTLGAVALETNDVEGAERLFQQALDLARRAGLEWWIGASLTNLAFLAYRRGDLEEASRFSEEAVVQQRARGDPVGLAASLLNQGAIQFARGNAPSALSHYVEGLRLVQRLGSTSLTAELLEDFAGVLIAQGRLEVAARVLSSALAYRDRIGAPVLEWREPEIRRVIAQLSEELGPELYETARSAGAMLSIDQAVAEVLSIRYEDLVG